MPFTAPRGGAAACPKVRRSVIALATAAVAAGASAASADAGSIYYGAFVDGKTPTAYELSSGAFATHEAQSGKKLAMVAWGLPWKYNGAMTSFPAASMENVRQHGSIPVLNWCSWELGKGTNQADFQLRDVYSGVYDPYIRQWATDAKAWGKPFMLRFNHEMNGWWYPWAEGRTSTGATVNGNSPGDYVKAWRHVHDIFSQVGATNVNWVWAPNHMTTSSRYPGLASLYPGDAYVDWTGLSVYNKDASYWLTFDTALTGAGTTWLRNSYQDVVDLAADKPMMLAETGSAEAGDGGARKAGWITDMLGAKLPANAYPQIRAFVWFDWSDAGFETLPIDSSPAALAAFRTSVADPAYATNEFGGITASPIPAPDVTVTATPTPTATGTPMPTPTPATASTTTSLRAVVDTYSTSASPTSTAGGTSTQLQVDADPVDRAFLRFDLSSLAGKTVKSVKLRFRTTGSASAGSGTTHPVRYVADNLWKEPYLSYNNTVPVSSTTLGIVPPGTAPSTWYDVTLNTAAIQPRVGRLVSMAIVGGSADALLLSSRESTYEPQLVVTY